MHFTTEHQALRRTARQFVKSEINPYILEWEKEGQFPIHEVFKKMGNQQPNKKLKDFCYFYLFLNQGDHYHIFP